MTYSLNEKMTKIGEYANYKKLYVSYMHMQAPTPKTA